jgi:hypothetical protein
LPSAAVVAAALHVAHVLAALTGIPTKTEFLNSQTLPASFWRCPHPVSNIHPVQY